MSLLQRGRVVVSQRVSSAHSIYTLTTRPGGYVLVSSDIPGSSIRVRWNSGQIHLSSLWKSQFCRPSWTRHCASGYETVVDASVFAGCAEHDSDMETRKLSLTV